MRRAIIWSALVIGLGMAVWGMAQLATSSPTDAPQLAAQAITETDWVRGNREAGVILIEYSDLQCPACATYAPIVNRITEEFGDRIAFVYRHFPLSYHREAELAAQAAEAAGKQDKFWEMLELLFASQDSWAEKGDARERFIAAARSLDMDMGRFESDLESKEIRDKIESDYLSGVQSKVNATPTFFLNGEKIQPRSEDEFRNLILQKLNDRP